MLLLYAAISDFKSFFFFLAREIWKHISLLWDHVFLGVHTNQFTNRKCKGKYGLHFLAESVTIPVCVKGGGEEQQQILF